MFARVWRRLWILALVLPMVACGSTEPTASLPDHAIVRVVAASSLRFALPGVVTELRRREPGVDVEVSYTSSGHAVAQLRQGAPFDLFLSADHDFPQRLVDAGVGDRASLFTYARGRLALYSTENVGLATEGVTALRSERVARIAIANPEHAPYGHAAIAALHALGVYDAVEAKLVRGENVAQAANLVRSHAADVGVVAFSLTLAPTMDHGQVLELPVDAYPPLLQSGVVIPGHDGEAGARSLRALLLSARGQAILSRWGFISADAQPAEAAGPATTEER